MPRLPISLFQMWPRPAITAFILLCQAPLHAQQDSASYHVEPVIISTVKLVPDVQSQIDSNLLYRNADYSLEPAFVFIPGVRFESRGPGGSRRLTVRGSLLRSAFGVRGVKVYLDGLPITSPDGDTPLELLDPGMISNGVVLRGPHCAAYGPGTGGTILFDSKPTSKIGRLGGSGSLIAGGFGYMRAQAGINLASKKGTVFGLNYVRQKLDGYREQEGNHKDFIHLHFRRKFKNHEIQASALGFTGNWELPGGLVDSVAAQDPRSALPYSVDAKASVFREWRRISLHHLWQKDNSGSRTGIYGISTAKVNAYGTSPAFQGFKSEYALGTGFRSEFWHLIPMRNAALKLKASVEYQSQASDQDEYENVQGSPGSQRRSDEILTRSALAGLNMDLVTGFGTLAVSGGLNLLDYTIRDRFLPDSIDFSHDFKFRPVPQYQVKYLYGWNLPREWSATTHVFVSSGYSPPGLWEILHEDGSLNLDLKSETGTNLEAGIALLCASPNSIHLHFTAYHFWLNDILVPYTDTIGVLRYQNSAKSIQRGLELEFLADVLPLEHDKALGLTIRSSIALQDYAFVDTVTKSMGKPLAGIPGITAAFGADLQFTERFTVLLTHQSTGKIYLTNENDVYQKPYHVLNIRGECLLSIQKTRKLMEFKVIGGINNLLNARYSNYLNLNDARKRFWNPAPTIHGYLGLEFRI